MSLVLLLLVIIVFYIQNLFLFPPQLNGLFLFFVIILKFNSFKQFKEDKMRQIISISQYKTRQSEANTLKQSDVNFSLDRKKTFLCTQCISTILLQFCVLQVVWLEKTTGCLYHMRKIECITTSFKDHNLQENEH